MRVWDLPIRLFHWAVVALLAFSWWSAEQRAMEWHYLSGLTVLGLLMFRLIWGVTGSNTARFSGFVARPARVMAYLRAESEPAAGHNPLGGYAVLALLIVIGAQAATGLFATDIDGLESGPLSFLVSFDEGRTLAKLHHLNFNLLLALTAVHVLAIAFYLVIRRRNLLRPMITGRDPQVSVGTALVPAPFWKFVLAAAIAAGSAYAANRGFWL